MNGAPWAVQRRVGRAGALHGLDLPVVARRVVWPFELTGPAVALGSTQPVETVDTAAAARAGLDVVRRRSGGGAVLLVPGDVTWVDVVISADDPLWAADVGRSFGWLGRAWARALGSLGVSGATVHDGPVVRGPWSDLVCFGGLGPGEVTVDGRKVVGLSQRRTRAGARFQCALLHRWDPAALLAVCALDARRRSQASVDLADVAAGIGPTSADDVRAALAAELAAASR